MHFRILLASLLLFGIINSVFGARKRCFVCRSRGPLGDCKDDFAFNVTTASAYGSAPVETQPCASGWCGKVLEDEEEGAHIVATERMCLTRPPSDGKERCSKTMYANKRNKQFFMCFCKGDLCNSAPSSLLLDVNFISVLTIISIVFSNVQNSFSLM